MMMIGREVVIGATLRAILHDDVESTFVQKRIKVTDLYFLYEENHFSHFWDIFVSNGSNLITTTKPTTTSKTTTTTTIS